MFAAPSSVARWLHPSSHLLRSCQALSLCQAVRLSQCCLRRVVVNIDGTESDEQLCSLPKISPIAALLNIDSSLSRLHASRRVFDVLKKNNIDTAVIHHRRFEGTPDRSDVSITTGSEIGGLLVDGLGDGVLLESLQTDLEHLVSTSFGLLQVRSTCGAADCQRTGAPHHPTLHRSLAGAVCLVLHVVHTNVRCALCRAAPAVCASACPQQRPCLTWHAAETQ